jgi:dipeptidyl aminopeptidase/acylaminoacyl peptidase
MRRVRTSAGTYLGYLKVTGKNSDLFLIKPGMTKPIMLAPEGNSPASTEITRTEASYGGRNGVLLAPADLGSGKHDLFIWLHGGPMRQVALGYHSYLSYAVYDELLERLAAGGSYVYKLDYTGSQGYGAQFRKALNKHIGTVEIDDVANAIAAIKKDKKIDHVYLIGNSYGGYMALRGLVDMPDVLSGVVSINGVTDWYGLISEIPSSPFAALFGGVPDTSNLQLYFQASVFLGMEKLTSKNKALVIWGDSDSEVPPSQSQHYVDYATAKGLNVKALTLPGEDHIIRARASLDTICSAVTSYLGVKASCSE